MNKKDWAITLTTWAVVQILFVWIFGINDQEEALKYIGAAKNILAGNTQFSLPDIWYSGYTGIHVILGFLGFPPGTMYAIQLFVSLVSLIYFVRILNVWIVRRVVLLFSSLLYATCFTLQQWVPQLFTDSLFYMLLIVAMYYLIAEERNRTHQILCWTFILIIPFFRPIGFLFVMLACMHWIFVSPRKNLKNIIPGLIYLIVLLILVFRSLMDPGSYFYPLHNAEANVICGLKSSLSNLEVQPYQPSSGMFVYFVNNPTLASRLFFARLMKVFDLTRPFFSFYHNVALAISCIVYYSLAATGLIWIIKAHRRELWFLGAGVILFSVPSVIFCVEWHGRMSLPVLCFVLILSGLGLNYVMDRPSLKSRQRK